MYKVSNWFKQSDRNRRCRIDVHRVIRSLDGEWAWTTVPGTRFVYYAAYLARVEREQKTAVKDARFGAHFTQMCRFSD
jgi:hypothetical protein